MEVRPARRRPPRGSSPSARNTRIRVTVRVRPRIAEDEEVAATQPALTLSDECIEEDPERAAILLRRPYYDTREFSLDCVLGRRASQAQTYEAVARGLVDDVLNGFNGTILAYGQTGTGKTHTIYGPLSYWRKAPSQLARAEPSRFAPVQDLQPRLELSGIVTRAAMQVFAAIEELQSTGDGRSFNVSLSSLQIYQETISDLLNPSTSAGLAIREDPSHGIFVEGLSEHAVHSPDHVLELVEESATNRATCSTSMNRSSSRSHAMLLLRVEHSGPPDQVEDAEGGGVKRGASPVAIRRGLLNIVDLAGSERVCKSGSEGTRLEEAKRINKSIASLGNCIAALASGGGKGSAHVPFRDSKLTRLLTDSLGGNTKTSLCATIGPSLHNYDETFCTLLLATRAMAVKTHARINERIEGGAGGAAAREALLMQMRALQDEVNRLRRERGAGSYADHSRLRPRPPLAPSGHSSHHALHDGAEPPTITPFGSMSRGGTLPPSPASSRSSVTSQIVSSNTRLQQLYAQQAQAQGRQGEAFPRQHHATAPAGEGAQRSPGHDEAEYRKRPTNDVEFHHAEGNHGHAPSHASADGGNSAWDDVAWGARVDMCVCGAGAVSAPGMAPSFAPTTLAEHREVSGRKQVVIPPPLPPPLPPMDLSELDAQQYAQPAPYVDPAGSADPRSIRSTRSPPMPYPSPSALPVPSQLTSTLIRNSSIAQRASNGPSLSDDGGDLVLDQLVSGLLATPCIRRRLDQLYGKAPANGLADTAERATLLTHGNHDRPTPGPTPSREEQRKVLKLPPPLPMPQSY
ncbi:hypothetical protein AB1Y20_009524 [Prymnesium parvum]|uniref:Kinesin motor domain-containing protein n=1 Tax=Prymnesium parvum TaxID=97485 RepID=A0AB34K4F8_PRYPA